MEDHQRARVLDAAVAMFAEKGYPATTVDDLVVAAKIGVGSFYAFFSGKEQCLLAAYDRIAEEARAAVVASASEGASWPDGVCRGLRRLLTWIQAEPTAAQVALVEIQTGGPEAVARYEESLAAAGRALGGGRQSLARNRRLPESLEQTTVNGVAWLLRRRLTAGESEAILGLYKELGEMILEPYIGAKRAKKAVAQSAAATAA
ncbi:MAG TPA: helix-turn-helix domain-containing protein [Solirubrobacterales bacterium]|nr:helix-turn-helix domain-containing protein [Solirubrobacterales bacterium]